MALLKFLKGQDAKLTEDKLKAAQAGWIFVTEDTGNMYIKTASAGTDGHIQLNANLANALRVSSKNTSLMNVGSENQTVYFFQGKPALSPFYTYLYGTCNTLSTTYEKQVELSLSNFTLKEGQIIYVKFLRDNEIDGDNLRLNIGGTGGYKVYYNGSLIKSYHLNTNEIHAFRFNGSAYEIISTDNKVMQIAGNSTMTNWRPLVIGSANNPTSNFTSFGTKIDSTYVFTNILAQPSTGTIKAAKFDGTATAATKLSNTTAIGGTTQPVYFKADGTPEKISYTISKSVPSNAVFTDTKVTSVSNHYTPTAISSAQLSADASSTTAATWGSTDLVTGVNLQRDAAGHVTGITVDSIQMPAKPASGETIKVTATNTKNQYLYLTGVTSSSSSDSASLYVTGGSTTALGPRIEPESRALYGAVWNDYAECRETKEDVKPGRVVCETGKGDLILSTERLQAGANIVSDTFGFIIGETSKAKTPIAVSGRVLAYPLEDRMLYAAGDAVCAGPNGTVSIMTREEIREYPDRILGTVSEIPDYKVWGENDVVVDGRIWIKVR